MDKMKIFISYSHLDKEIAHRFYEYLTNLNYDIIWDENTIIIGDTFDRKLKSALYNADIYLPIISDHFEKSYFTKNELLMAIGYHSGRERPKIFPYIVKGNRIPSDMTHILCFMGTDDIDMDLEKIGFQLEKVKGTILAQQKIETENAANLSSSLDAFLEDVFDKLEKNEKRNRRLAYVSYIFSALFLLLTIPLIIFKLNYLNHSETELAIRIFAAIQNIAILAVLAALSRLLFILGKSFMVESIRNGDRVHAISFGKFYIQAYGKQANRQEIRDVLGEWNIDKGSSFRTQDAKEIDPNFLGTLEVIKSYFSKN